MTKKICAIMVKKMVKVKKNTGFFENIFKWGKILQGFFKRKILKFVQETSLFDCN